MPTKTPERAEFDQAKIRIAKDYQDKVRRADEEYAEDMRIATQRYQKRCHERRAAATSPQTTA